MIMTGSEIVDALAEHCHGDPEILSRAVKAMLDSVPEMLAPLQTMLRHGQLHRLKRLVHRLKGTAKTCGAVVLCELAEDTRRHWQYRRHGAPPARTGGGLPVPPRCAGDGGRRPAHRHRRCPRGSGVPLDPAGISSAATREAVGCPGNVRG
jgi:HPt (histidine-containing phosphotransfer) domain-containing protein